MQSKPTALRDEGNAILATLADTPISRWNSQAVEYPECGHFREANTAANPGYDACPDVATAATDTPMANPLLGLRTVILMVDDLAEAKAWYTKAFYTEPYFDNGVYIGFSVSGYELGLMQDDIPAAAKSENVLSYWGVEDIEAEYQRLLGMGATEHEKPVNVGGEIMVATVKDPWGNIVGLIYNPEFRPERDP